MRDHFNQFCAFNGIIKRIDITKRYRGLPVLSNESSGRVVTWCLICLPLICCSSLIFAKDKPDKGFLHTGERYDTTFEKFLSLADTDNAEAQNLLGFMLFHGEGVRKDYDLSHYWFHRAAENDSHNAQGNLVAFHSGSIKPLPKYYYAPDESAHWNAISQNKNLYSNNNEHQFKQNHKAFSEQGPVTQQLNQPLKGTLFFGKVNDWLTTLKNRSIYFLQGVVKRIRALVISSEEHRISWEKQHPDALKPTATATLVLGESTFIQFCAGCHGFNGISYYVNSPSFALRERLDKSDKELARSTNHGIGIMPGWEDKLTSQAIDATVRFIRTLGPSYDAGITNAVRRPKQNESIFLFRPKGETTNRWLRTNPLYREDNQ